MEFSPAFTLLGKFTTDIPESDSESHTINENDIVNVAEYLGLKLPEKSLQERIEIIQNELLNQNKVLTENISIVDVDKAEIYKKSRFVREIVLNNRARKQVD
ncbi:MAG: hypothetical protein ACLPID_14615 [Beijerinckiaceae bacterium]